jgi:hypothetical protein
VVSVIAVQVFGPIPEEEKVDIDAEPDFKIDYAEAQEIDEAVEKEKKRLFYQTGLI